MMASNSWIPKNRASIQMMSDNTYSPPLTHSDRRKRTASMEPLPASGLARCACLKDNRRTSFNLGLQGFTCYSSKLAQEIGGLVSLIRKRLIQRCESKDICLVDARPLLDQ